MNRPAHPLVRDAAERYLRIARLSHAEQLDHLDLRALLHDVADRLGFSAPAHRLTDDAHVVAVDHGGVLFLGIAAADAAPSDGALPDLGALFRELRCALDHGHFVGALFVAATRSHEAASRWARELSRHAESSQIREVRDDSFTFETGPLLGGNWAAFLTGVV